MKRIGLVCQHFYPEMISTGMHMTELATGLAEQGWPLRVYCGQPVYSDADQAQRAAERTSAYKGVEIVRVPAFGSGRRNIPLRILNAFSFLLGILWVLFRDRGELCGLINTTNPPFIGLAPLLVSKVTGLRYITIVYDLYPEVAVCIGALPQNSAIVSLWKRITAAILRGSDVLIVIGRDMKELVAAKLSRHDHSTKVVLIPNWSDHTLVTSVPRERNEFLRGNGLAESFVVQYSGRMGRTHNLEPLLDAAHILSGTNVVFQFIGDGAKKPILERRVASEELSNVQFLPYQPYESLAQVLSAASLAVVCLSGECTGYSVPSKTYGIMASGRPILALLRQDSEIGLAIREADCGYVLAQPTGQTIAEVIQELMNSPDVAASMGLNGQRAFLDNYTLTKAVEAYGHVLTETFANNHPDS